MYPKVSTGQDAPQAVASSPSFPELEKRVLQYWDTDGTFRTSIENRDAGKNGANEFVFYDGPPFANGLPHYGHLLTGYVKDVVPRFQTMRGKRVERRFGWDTHGLPAELEAMSQLGIRTKEEILELGIETFNEKCRESVMKYADEWRTYVTRQARWVDFDNDYRTMNPTFMESVLWAFKELHSKGLVYEGFRVLPYCWNDETPLSNHELRMDDEVYKSRQDPAVTVGFRLETGELALIWTTTPWTLPSNLAIMVGADLDYVVVESDVPTGTRERYILGAERAASYARELTGDPKGDVESLVVQRLKGSELISRTYAPPFSYYADHENAFRVVDGSEFVTTTDGTGLVHSAGAFGEADKQVTDREGIEPVMPVGADGRFTAPVTEYAGMLVFDANAHVMEHLKAATRGKGETGCVTPGTVLLRRETYDHSYPHCWRCRNPLIYKGVSSWFVAVTKIKERMGELNQEINWVPEHVKDGQFGKWVEGARDWSITRNRFWGSPVPVWKSDNPEFPRLDVYGSFEELEKDFGALPRNAKGEPDLHRPYIDELTRPNPDDPSGKSMMRRVPDVLDVWFDSGSMSFAQVHYPFENGEWFEHHFPADFIVEYIGQTRGWFYTLHILATALFDRPAFANCVSHGIVLGNDGQKMSKSLKNYPDVNEVFDRDGADAMRWFLMSSPILRGGNLIVTEEGIRDGVRQVLLPLWSTWYFFTLYTNSANHGAGYEAKWRTDSQNSLDQYLLGLTGKLVRDVEQALESLDIARACDLTQEYLDGLTNWYIRRSRDRFWAEDTDAFDTLYTALEVVCRVVAPLAPMVSEEIWRGLTGSRSVHLADWPVADDLPHGPQTDALLVDMTTVREACSVALGLRKANSLRVRLPLPEVTVVAPHAASLEPLAQLISQEINVASVKLADLAQVGESDFGIERRLTVNARAAGPRLGRTVQQAIKGSKSGDWSVSDAGVVTAGGIELVEGEYELDTVVAQGEGSDDAAVGVLPSGGFIVLDTQVTPELEAVGLANDVVRIVQQARRAAGLAVSDHIRLTVTGEGPVWEALVNHQNLLVTETLADSVGVSGNLTDLPEGDGVALGEVAGGHKVRVKVAKI